ncbi:LuxR family transcriptional regulator [Yersinia aldovae]|uniref:LuxR family transcriptional regulator n=1 Tax=Yersinia aldovae TaxID=29483 RepID=UPI0005AC3CD7|nr:LuxR family transcriptional regulator [Yersinia aldovae]AJJ62765.1 bacterial regulatory s, luxR family protein [Yersinia aldovae 670-83]
MHDVIIFSNCDLIRFSLEKIVDNVLAGKSDRTDFSIKVCSSLAEFECAILSSINPIVFFDIDNVSISEKYQVCKFIGRKVNKGSVVFFSKENELPVIGIFSKKINLIFVCKTESIVKIELVTHHCLFSTDVFLDMTFATNTNIKTKSHFLKLTRREKEVLPYLLSGMPSKSIAMELGVSVKTLSAHKINIFKKYNATSLVNLCYKLTN